jgi:cation diffusion facilitator CzcD-associated flavoprotein CzcO
MDYLERVCECFKLKRYMRFESEVLGAQWDEDSAKWTVQIKQTQADGSTRTFEDTCDLLLQCTGILGFPKLPTIPGLDKFKGNVSSSIHGSLARTTF